MIIGWHPHLWGCALPICKILDPPLSWLLNRPLRAKGSIPPIPMVTFHPNTILKSQNPTGVTFLIDEEESGKLVGQ